MQTWTIAPLTSADVAEYVHAHLVMLETTYAHLADPAYGPNRWAEHGSRVAALHTDIAETAAADAAGRPTSHRHFVARSAHGTIIGIACSGVGIEDWERDLFGDAWTPPGTDWCLRHLYTMPGTHGSGLADALLAAALPDGHEAYLWVIHGNDRAIRYYERHGFVATGLAGDCGPSWGSMVTARMERLPTASGA